ncbi:hypothetical protein GGU10DRAFT_363878 [Lentinula aff. detonsa]|uniref:Uncharacterized protein n=1 Tax=Lentinula aff. detonsa TaxID=2804958 RepID=A0AA38NK33_9AGAR|nr:hypothetical protein GGU10DRAFT_363878 [Lentinula aff. detonsa]
MRFYAVLLISSLLATVLAAPHAQLNHDSDTASLGRRGSTFSKSSPTQAAVQSPVQPSAKSETFPQSQCSSITENLRFEYFAPFSSRVG